MLDGNETIYGYIRYMENRYRFAYSQISKYVNWSLSETVQTVYAYLNSRHISGEKDTLGRDKPFFNIVTAARNVWFRATDIDRKNVKVYGSHSSSVIPAFLATQFLQRWMRDERFGEFLNDWGLTLAGFGSAVTKWVRKGGKLIPSVVPWSRIICDNVDFAQNPVIEVLEFTPAELTLKKEYDPVAVKSLLSAQMNRITVTGQIVDPKPEYIRVYEIHGMLPLSYVTEKDGDRTRYAQQMHVVSYTRVADGTYKDFTLYKGREDESPYDITHLLKEDGRAIAIGAVEHLFQSQWQVNHSVKSIKDQLDLASKLVFQTSDPSFVGRNVLTSIEQGQILQHKVNEPVTSFPNTSHDVSSQQSMVDLWRGLGNEINGIADAMLGEAPKSGMSWRLQSLQINEAQELFSVMAQNKGMALEDMVKTRIIPFVRTTLRHSRQIAAVLESSDVRRIDSLYIPETAIRRYNSKVLNHVMTRGRVPRPSDGISLQGEMKTASQELAVQGNTRYFKPSDIDDAEWHDILDDDAWEGVVIDITGEAVDTQGVLSTLNTALQMVMNPAYASNPQAQLIVGKILAATGMVSPLELSTTMPTPSTPIVPTLQYRNPSVPNAAANSG